MSAGKHTPGPWFVTGRLTKYVEARIGGGLIQEVAAVGPTRGDNGYGEQQEANARLIAAAPELLQALEMMILFNRPMKGNAVALNAAYQAIAKATGTAE